MSGKPTRKKKPPIKKAAPAKAAAGRKPPRPPPPPRFRPNPKRQMVFVLLALAALGIGYLVGEVGSRPKPLPPPPKAEMEMPAPPDPALDNPILPDPAVVPSTGAPLAYEEALPEEIHTTTVSLPMPPPAPPPLPAPPAQPVGDVEPGGPLPQAQPEPRPPMPALRPGSPAAKNPAPPPPPVPLKPVERIETLATTATPPAKANGNGLPAWRQYAVAAPDTRGKGMIAVVIDDLGVDRGRTAKVIGLPGPLTTSFLTYAQDLARQAEMARQHGHELLLHVPMEPSSISMDPGPNVLATRLSTAEIADRLTWGLSRLEGYVGINNHMGSKFTADTRGMTVVMQELKRRGLLFLDSRTVGHTAGPEAALKAGVPFAERNVFLDNVDAVAEVRARLADLEAVALKHGYAIGIGHPRDATIAALAEWTRHLKDKGLVLVPLTTIVGRLQNPG
ncbi:MAG: divergent polysaccharide deacetylase family protein [Magnetospirillum sp. WYHS-4]